jgi:hypothetical protein
MLLGLTQCMQVNKAHLCKCPMPLLLPFKRNIRFIYSGVLFFKGCNSRAFNVDSRHVVEPVQRIEVIAALPLLRAHLQPRSTESDAAVTLLHGENRSIRLRLENCSSIVIRKIRLKMYVRICLIVFLLVVLCEVTCRWCVHGLLST